MTETDYKTSPTTLMKTLDYLGIAYEVFEHEAVFTVEESHKVVDIVPGAHCRNLALYNKKKKMWLMVAEDCTPVDLKKLDSVLGSGRLSFMRPERLWDVLGVTPGSVTPFSVMNDTAHKVQLVLDARMMRRDLVNYHPMANTMSLALTPQDLLRFFAHTGHDPILVEPEDIAPDIDIGADADKAPARQEG